VWQGEIPPSPDAARSSPTAAELYNFLRDSRTICRRRGILLPDRSTDVYEGMIIGRERKDTDLDVQHSCAEKTDQHAARPTSGRGDPAGPFRNLNLEQAMSSSPRMSSSGRSAKSLRLRKKILPIDRRKKVR